MPVYCATCNIEAGPKSPHYAKEICPICKRHFRWIPKTENKNKRKPSKFTPANLSIFFCELCGRNGNALGNKEVLEVHHKIPICDGGLDEKDNILIVCSACHRMVHWLRTYVNNHLQQEINNAK